MRTTGGKYRFLVLYADGVEVARRPHNTPKEKEDADNIFSVLRYNSRYVDELQDAKFAERIEYR